MKKSRKVIAVAFVAAMLLSLVACGGERADSEYVGKYVAVVGEALGVSMTGDDLLGFSIELKEKGKGTIVVDGDSGSAAWTNDDTSVTLKVSGQELVGTIGKDTLTFEDMMGMGLTLTFAKEGTDAANPENYLPENEKNMIGVWKSQLVTDVLGDDASEEVEPTAITIEFRGDLTATASMSGTELGEGKWFFFGDSGYFEDDYVISSWEINGDEIELTYSDGDNYWLFTCVKQ